MNRDFIDDYFILEKKIVYYAPLRGIKKNGAIASDVYGLLKISVFESER